MSESLDNRTEELDEELLHMLRLLQQDRVRQYFEQRRQAYYETIKPLEPEEYYEGRLEKLA